MAASGLALSTADSMRGASRKRLWLSAWRGIRRGCPIGFGNSKA